MNKKPVHIPILRLITDDVLREIRDHHPKAKKYFKLLTKKERKKLQDECDEESY